MWTPSFPHPSIRSLVCDVVFVFELIPFSGSELSTTGSPLTSHTLFLLVANLIR